MRRGLYRDGNFVQVDYDGMESIPISRHLYEQRGYGPPFDQLPTREQFEDRMREAGRIP